MGIQTASQAFGNEGIGGFTFRNLLINGDQSIAQRNTSATGVTSGDYKTVDRWGQNIATAGTWTITQDTDAPAGFAYSSKWTCTTASASPSVLQHYQAIEGQNLQHLCYGTSSAKSLTVSFWVKSNKTGTYTVRFIYYKPDGSMRILPKSYTINAVNTWEKKIVTIPGDTSAAIRNTTTTGINIAFWLGTVGSYTGGSFQESWTTYTNNLECPSSVNLADTINNYWAITGVQLEVGSNATSFETRPYSTELAMCQRYLPAIDLSSGTRNTAVGMVYDGTRAIIPLFFPVTARSVPTGVTYTGTVSNMNIYLGNSTKALTALQFNDATFNTGCVLASVSSGLTGGQCVLLTGELSASTKLLFTGCEL